MHKIVRQSARHCIGRISKRRIQRFSTTNVRHASNSRPEDQDKAHKHNERKTAFTRDAHAADEVTEIGEGRRSLRRTLRPRRPTDIPKPPPLPAWFFRRNVVLHTSREGDRSDKTGCVSCVDKDTGKTLFTIPCSPATARQFARGLEEQGNNDKSKDLDDQAQVERGEQTSVVRAPQHAQDVSASNIAGFFGNILETLPLHKHASSQKPAGAVNADGNSWESPGLWYAEVEALAKAAFVNAGRALPTYAAKKAELSLHTYDERAGTLLDEYVAKLALVLGADIVRVDANDLADLTEHYVGQGSDLPGTFSTLAHQVFDGYKAAESPAEAMMSLSRRRNEDEENDEDDEDDADEEEEDHTAAHDSLAKRLMGLHNGSVKALTDMGKGANEGPVGFSFAVPIGIMPGRNNRSSNKRESSSESDYVQWDDARLAASLEQVVDAANQKRSNDAISHSPGSGSSGIPDTLHNILRLLASDNTRRHPLHVQVEGVSHPKDAGNDARRTIVQVRDLKAICASKLGEAIISRLVKIVQRRRRLGEEILVVGTSAGSFPSPTETEEPTFHTLCVPGQHPSMFQRRHEWSWSPKEQGGYHRIMEINSRNIGSTMRRIQQGHTQDELLLVGREHLLQHGEAMLSQVILPQDIVHRIVLAAIGVSKQHMQSADVGLYQLGLAASILASTTRSASRPDRIVASLDMPGFEIPFPAGSGNGIQSATGIGKDGDNMPAGKQRLDMLRRSCNSHETRLFSGVIDPKQIKVGFGDVHVAPETIQALKDSTSLTLLRPDAFRYGVLARDRLSGVMLYGPPGTGKTLLAKAVAKDSQATVLEVSGAQVYQKYVGEGEKMVQAVFSLAQKLSPCVVFIDEADALFGSRDSASNRNTHRELINQFLKEWDGLNTGNEGKVLLMIATNRPSDVDDAVLRRLPRRLLVDLPSAKDRESILGIQLRDEELDSSVSLAALAEQTPLYSGSDLKNVCVAAALAAVREENDLVSRHSGDDTFKLPDKRTLHQRHFEKGTQEISASISEDMASLQAIRKFDERYGDKKGRKKKASYGFGALDAPIDENAARVRQDR